MGGDREGRSEKDIIIGSLFGLGNEGIRVVFSGELGGRRKMLCIVWNLVDIRGLGVFREDI